MYVHSGLSARFVRVLAMRLKIAQNARDLVEVSGASDNVQFVNGSLRSRQKMQLLQRSQAILLSIVQTF